MEWTDIRLTVAKADADNAEAVATMIAEGGIYIEDYSDIEQQVAEIAHVDLIEQELLDKPRDTVIIHLYLEPGASQVETLALIAARMEAAGIPYTVETEGVVIAYTSVYGNTKAAVEKLADKLRANGCPKVIVHDLARCDMAQAVADAFRYSKLVLATTTYNADVFPFMKEFIHHLTERNFRNRTVALMENGSWAPLAAKVMRKMLEECKNLTFTETTVRILSALNETSAKQVDALANELSKEYLAQQDATANKNDLTALFNIGYGLYVVTTNDGTRDNGLIVNTVSQVTNTPNRIAVTINKQNYSFHTIQKTGVLNVNCLDVSAPFSLFQRFGFQSGRTVDKFAGMEVLRSDNGLAFLPRYINSFMSLKVESYVDLDTHGMFICSVTEARVISDRETMTYTYYQKNVKPKPETEGKHGFVCKVCGWIYEGDELPDDIICPLCKHGAADFERLQ